MPAALTPVSAFEGTGRAGCVGPSPTPPNRIAPTNAAMSLQYLKDAAAGERAEARTDAGGLIARAPKNGLRLVPGGS